MVVIPTDIQKKEGQGGGNHKGGGGIGNQSS